MCNSLSLAVAMSKQLVQLSQGIPEAEFWERQKPLWKSITGSSDAKEGPTAFAEKRPPDWTGT